MGYKCVICNINTIFFVWSSSAPFPRDRLMKIKRYNKKQDMKTVLDGVPVCLKCRDMLNDSKV
jgi:hypothetical protein